MKSRRPPRRPPCASDRSRCLHTGAPPTLNLQRPNPYWTRPSPSRSAIGHTRARRSAWRASARSLRRNELSPVLAAHEGDELPSQGSRGARGAVPLRGATWGSSGAAERSWRAEDERPCLCASWPGRVVRRATPAVAIVARSRGTAAKRGGLAGQADERRCSRGTPQTTHRPGRVTPRQGTRRRHAGRLFGAFRSAKGLEQIRRRCLMFPPRASRPLARVRGS